MFLRQFQSKGNLQMYEKLSFLSGTIHVETLFGTQKVHTENKRNDFELKECSDVSTTMIVFDSLPNIMSLCVLLVF